MTRIDRLLAMLKSHDKDKAHILCRMPSGEEKAMDIFEALRIGASFIRTLDGSHDMDELYMAMLSGEEIDTSDLEEVDG